MGDGSLKSLDFIVSPADGCSWLVDVKGRRFPTASGEGKQYWKDVEAKWSFSSEKACFLRLFWAKNDFEKRPEKTR